MSIAAAVTELPGNWHRLLAPSGSAAKAPLETRAAADPGRGSSDEANSCPVPVDANCCS